MIEELHQVGDLIRDRYVINSSLGQGGMAITYAATDRVNEQAVAIKVLSLRQSSQWKVIELFEREAKVLEKAIEPATEDRFTSARIALEEIESNRHTPLVNNYIATLKASGALAETHKLKPLDSHIQYERTSDRLTFKIPSIGYKPLTWFFGSLSVLIYLGLDKFILPYIHIWGLLSQISLGFVACVVGLLLLLCAALFVYALVGNILIEMDRHTFQIAWHLLGIRIGRERGYNSEITYIGIDEVASQTKDKTIQYVYVICRDKTQHRFDSILMEKEEMDWIVGELLDFLSQVYSNKRDN